MANYIIVNGELYHHGVIGMKWGRRRYQNKDGTLTAAGKKRYDKEMEKAKAEQKVLKNKERTQAKIDKLNALKKDNEDRKAALDGPSATEKVKKTAKAAKDAKKRTIKDLSDAELKAKYDRLKLEQDYKKLMRESNPQQSSKGKEFVQKVFDKTVDDIAPQVTKHYVAKILNNLIGDTDEKGKIVERVFANNKKKS